MASRRVENFLPYKLAVFNLPQKLSVGALTLLCQEMAAESARSARISGYNSRTM